MPKINTIATVSVPKLSDKLVGTSVGGAPSNQTNNFTLQQLKTLFEGGSPPSSPNLQSVLNAGNTATQSIYLTGTLEATNVTIANNATSKNLYLSERLFDKNNAQGTNGQYLTSTGTGVQWSTLTIAIPTLQQVLTAGNVSDKNIVTTGNIQAANLQSTNLTANSNLRVVGTFSDSSNASGTSNQVLSSTVVGTSWVDLPSYSAVSPLIYNNTLKQFSIQQVTGTQNGYLSSADWITFNGKQNAGNYITALTGEATASGPGSASITLNNLAVINKTLTGFTTLSGTVTSADSIVTAFGKLQNQINGVASGLNYQGAWNASTNVPTLVSGVGTNGEYYVVDIAGNTNLNGITDWKIGDWAIFNGTSWQKIDNTDSVISVNGQIGVVVLNSDDIAEGSANLYYTDARSRSAISSLATGLTYTSSTGVFSLTAGYSIPTIANQTDWTTAYNNSIVSAAVTGTTTKTLTLTQQDGGTITASWTDIDTNLVTSVFGRTGVVVAENGDYSTTLVTEGANLYYLDSRARAAISSSATGLTYNPSTGAFTLTAGYSIPTDLEQADWDAAYNNSIVSASVTGTSTKTLTLNQQDGGTITADWSDADTGLTSVGVSMPSAFSVSNSPLTSNGTIAVAGAGTNLQYIDGTGALQTFPLLTGYVPYTGANQAVVLGYNSLNASILRIDGPSAPQGGFLGFKQSNNVIAGEGSYTSIYAFGSGYLGFKFPQSPTGYKDFKFDVSTITTDVPGGRVYSMPDADGTLALTSDIPPAGLTSVGLSMPAAFSVANSPLTADGTIAVSGAGTNLQYIDGTGALQTFPLLTGFVPYTGATTNVNLGTHSLTAADLVINHSSGSGVAASITKGGNGEALTVVKSSGSGNAASITGGVTLLDELHLTTDLADAYIASAATWNAKQDAITLTTTGSSGAATLIGDTLNIPNYAPDLSGYVTLGTDQTLTGLKTILRGGDVLNFKIGTDTLYGLKVAYNQNELVPSGEATWSFESTFNNGSGTGITTTPISFFRGVLVTGERLLSASVNANLLDYYGNNPTGRYPIYAYNTGVQQFASSIIVGETTGVVNAVTGAIADLPSGIVANFKGRVIGSDAVNANEFATLGQIGGGSIMVAGTGTCSTIRDGVSNTSLGAYSFAGGGCSNTVSKAKSSIVGGEYNTITNSAYDYCNVGSFIGGGQCNAISVSSSSIVAGRFNVICEAPYVSGFASDRFIGAGLRNTISSSGGSYSSIVGGYQNTISGYYNNGNVIAGGGNNTVSSQYSFIGAGNCNNVSGNCSGILGGVGNTVSNTCSFIVGSNITANRDCTTFVNDLIITSAAACSGKGVCFSTNGLLVPYTITSCSGTVTSVAALTLDTSGTDLSSSVANSTTTPVITLNVPSASATNRGALSAADWTTFNNKTSCLGTITSVTATSPLFSSGGTTPNITIQQSSGSQSGFLSSTDWTTFNNKTSCIGTINTLTTTGTGAATLVGNTLNIPTPSASASIMVAGSGTCSTLRCGVSNNVSGSYSGALSGSYNTASGNYSVVAGGNFNTASGNCSVVAGGSSNSAIGSRSSISGGGSNCACGNATFIGGGLTHCISTGAEGAFILGGVNNKVSNPRSGTIGGDFICATGFGSIVIGGFNFNGSANSTTYVQALSKTSGTFRINHPDPAKTATHYLQHSFVESPTRGDNIYRYKITTSNCHATLALPDYYKFLNEDDQVFVTPNGHFGSAYGVIDSCQNSVNFTSNTDGEYNVLIIGTRKDIDAKNGFLGVEVWK